MKSVTRLLPILEWGRTYDRTVLVNDLVAASIVTIMLIPQSLAYAMLAGLPPQVGLYASIFPIAAYAIFGTSRTLAVGPVAVARAFWVSQARRFACFYLWRSASSYHAVECPAKNLSLATNPHPKSRDSLRAHDQWL